MFETTVYSRRRKALSATLHSGVILLPGNEQSSMNYTDNQYHFRQDSCFLYYTGIDKASLYFVIDIDHQQEVLFGDEATIDDIVWMGAQQSLRELAGKAGIATVQPLSRLAAFLKDTIRQKRKIHFTPPYRSDTTMRIGEWLGVPYLNIKEQASIELIKAIVEQRSIKDAAEVSEIEKAVDITVDMQLKAMSYAAEGIPEYEIAGLLEGIAASKGGHLAFPTILTVNGQYLHNHAGHTPLQKGDMVLCDCGAESALHYAGDLTRTSPVSGQFTSQQKEIYQVVLNAQKAAINALQPGRKFIDIHFTACEKLTEGLQQLGLMKGNVQEAVAAGAHTLFFQCGLGHMLGLDVHDMENLGEEYVGYTDDLKKSKDFGLKSLRLARALQPGFVLTVEPGLYFIPELMDIWTADKRHNNFINYDKLASFRNAGGIRIEDDALITGSGSRILGKSLVKEISEVEALCQ